MLRNVKQASSKWVNENRLSSRHFAWQEGYGAFSYSLSQLPRVIKYIENQQEHHRKQGFREEYKRFLEAFEVIYDEKYIFHDPED